MMSEDSDGLRQTSGLVPVPDPTTLTNQLVAQAVNALRDVIETRFAGSEALVNEKFRAIGERFELLDKQTIKAAADVKSAVDAAFAAAASGVSQQNQANFLASQKQEGAFTKQIDQLGVSVVQTSKAIDDKVSDLKDRIVAIEGRSSGSSQTIGFVIGVAGVVVAVVAVMMSMVHFGVRQ
jgi:hypothetical protein